MGALVPQYHGHHVPDEDIQVRKEKRAAVVDEVGQSDMCDVCGGKSSAIIARSFSWKIVEVQSTSTY